VRTFKKMVYDPLKFRSVKIKLEKEQQQQKEEQQGGLRIFTEAVMGGAFIGMIHFIQKDDKNRQSQKSVVEASGSFSARYWFYSMSLGFSSKNASEIESLASSLNMNIKIEFMSFGALPSIQRHQVNYSVMKFKDLAPSKFDLSKEDEKDIAELVTLSGYTAHNKKLAESSYKRQFRMEDAGMAIANAARATETKEKSLNVHTMESLHEAFESFIEKMQNDPDCGIPIGFNYRNIDPEEVDQLVKDADAQVDTQRKILRAQQEKAVQDAEYKN